MITRTVAAIRANIVAWLALFVALTGTSMAASHYIITSTHQIKPSVLKQLKAANGKTGPAGLAGPTGPRGDAGQEGKEGKATQGSEGKQGIPGKDGTEGKPGPRGTALAFAHITAVGGIDQSVSENFEAVTVQHPTPENPETHKPEGGLYCITGLPTTVKPHNVSVTVDDKATQEPYFATATIGRSNYVASKSLCGTETQITVEVWTKVTTAPEMETTNAPFYITVN